MTDLFEAPIKLAEFEAYIIAAALDIASPRESATAAVVRERFKQFIIETWPEPNSRRIVEQGRVNIPVAQLEQLMADAQKWREQEHQKWRDNRGA
jgi:hypothetical protein